MEGERQLVERVLAGQRGAFAEFVRRYERLVYHVVARLIPEVSDREEVCQTVFLRAYAGLAGFSFNAKLSTWLARIAFRSGLNHLQRNRRLWSAEWDGEPERPGVIGDIPDCAESQVDRLVSRDAADLLHAEIMMLPLAQRTVVTLFHLEEMSLADIAVVVGLPEGTVKSHLFRARRALKERLTGRVTAGELSR
jgi:RNA polymerase sigma-70 factor (ECF subfamily)